MTIRASLFLASTIWLLTSCGENSFQAKQEAYYQPLPWEENLNPRCPNDSQLAYYGPPPQRFELMDTMGRGTDTIYQAPDSVYLSQHGLPYLYSNRYNGEEAYQLLFSPTFEDPLLVGIHKEGENFCLTAYKRAGQGIHYFRRGNCLVFMKADGSSNSVLTPSINLAIHSRYLTGYECDSLQYYLREAHFWDCPLHRQFDNRLMFDGEQVTMYGYRNGERNYRTEHSPHGSPYSRLCAYMLRLSGFTSRYQLHRIQ